LLDGGYVNLETIISPHKTTAAIVEVGGPRRCDPQGIVCFPRYNRIDVVDLKTGTLTHLT
jgi:hypothetical protein